MSSPSSLLDPAVPHREVKAAVKQAWRNWQRADYRLALGLRRLFRDQVHRGSGRGDFGDWAESVWGIPRKQVWTFNCLGEHLERLPALREAMESGLVTYTKAREFAAVAQEEDIGWWVDFAGSHSHREVLREKERGPARKSGKDHKAKLKVVRGTSDTGVHPTATGKMGVGLGGAQRSRVRRGTRPPGVIPP